MTHNGRTYHGFPTPDALAAADATTLRALRISRQKARYITGIAQRVWEGEVTDAVAHLDDGALIQRLTAILGIVFGLPASAYWALLIANTFVPLINRMTRRRVLGT